MKTKQLYYTSCRKGQTGSAGFQVWACSDGIDAEDRREIERRGSYRPPRGANQNPSTEEIQQDFPKALRFYTLASGRWCLSMSSYAGKDYSDRWGNFFAHTLLSESGMPPVWPIDYYEWAGWKMQLAGSEDNGAAPAPLPALDFTAIPPADGFAFDDLKEFLQESRERKQVLADMIRAVFKYVAAERTTSSGGASSEPARAIVIRDNFLNNLYWVACIQKAFPLSLVSALSFSTYQMSASDCAVVNATVEGTDFLFNDTERNYQFYMFDFVTRAHSSIDPASGDYAELMTQWMAEAPQRVENFHAFCRHFDLKDLDVSLQLLLRLYQATLGEPVDIGGGLQPLITFVREKAKPLAYAELREPLHALAMRQVKRMSASEFEAMASLLLGLARNDPSAVADRLFDLWLKMFRRFVLEEDAQLEAVVQFRKKLEMVVPSPPSDWASRFLAPDMTRHIHERVGFISSAARRLCLRETAQALTQLGRRPLIRQPEYEAIVKAIAEKLDAPLLAAAMKNAQQEPETLPELCEAVLRYGNTGTAQREKVLEAIGDALYNTFSAQPPQNAIRMRQVLDAAGASQFLLQEWRRMLARAANKQDLHYSYTRDILPHLPAFASQNRIAIDSALLDALPKEQRPRLALKWLLAGNADAHPEIAKEWIQLASAAISLDDISPSGMEEAIKLRGLCKSLAFTPRPNLPLLKVLSGSVAESHASDWPWDIFAKRVAEAVSGLDSRTFELFLRQTLATVLGAAPSLDVYGSLLEAYTAANFSNVLRDAYLQTLKRQTQRADVKGLCLAFTYWLSPSGAEAGATGLAAWRDTVLQYLARECDNLRIDDWDKVKAEVDKNPPFSQLGSDAWIKIKAMVERPSMGKRVKGMWTNPMPWRKGK